MNKKQYIKETEELRAWLRKCRLEKGLSMRDLADKLGDVHHSQIGRIELGERKLNIAEYKKYCRALGVEGYRCL